ncbi:hypothetical protein BSKO_13237 [Bryopsis sp. KO-2023]|nr:hypothetical protein BSKO_13237 [Bryopsis sp. KO-2023]
MVSTVCVRPLACVAVSRSGVEKRSLTSAFRVGRARPRISISKRSKCVIRAIQVSGPGGGGGNPPDPEQGKMTEELINGMKTKISEALEAEKVDIADIYGDGRHVSIDVVSSTFEGQSSVQRQRMVYRAIWLELQDAVHAVDAMTTKTPKEAAG